MNIIRLALALTLILFTFQWMKASYPDYTGMVNVKALSNRMLNVMWGD